MGDGGNAASSGDAAVAVAGGAGAGAVLPPLVAVYRAVTNAARAAATAPSVVAFQREQQAGYRNQADRVTGFMARAARSHNSYNSGSSSSGSSNVRPATGVTVSRGKKVSGQEYPYGRLDLLTAPVWESALRDGASAGGKVWEDAKKLMSATALTQARNE